LNGKAPKTTWLFRLIFFTLLVAIISHPSSRCGGAQAQDTVEMYMVNPLTGDNTFNLSNSPIGGVFTIEFYVGNVTDMVTWQIHLTYNRTLINYDQVWFPDDNVFKSVIDQGVTPMKGISVNVDNATDTADILIVMTCTYPPSSSQKYPVSVISRGLLCKANFTVAVHPVCEQLEFVTHQSSSSSLHVTLPYYLTDFRTSVETLNGTYIADGKPAIIDDVPILPEASVLLLLTCVPVTVAFALVKRRNKN
jgi:hypothetical protein